MLVRVPYWYRNGSSMSYLATDQCVENEGGHRHAGSPNGVNGAVLALGSLWIPGVMPPEITDLLCAGGLIQSEPCGLLWLSTASFRVCLLGFSLFCLGWFGSFFVFVWLRGCCLLGLVWSDLVWSRFVVCYFTYVV